MKPPKKPKTEYEHIPKYDEWVFGVIEDIEHEKEHEKTFNGEKSIIEAVRFKFSLEGCSFPHRSRWLTFSYGEKSNLYKTFISQLVEGAQPDMDFDLQQLKGLKVKTMWTRNEEYDNLTMIRPSVEKVKPSPEESPKAQEEKQENVPF